ncbi:MAG TPA: hypothetical protein GXX40_08255 [Firmicutes bacterium]|nr:hypothetical protein [Bacillota bacterium]
MTERDIVRPENLPSDRHRPAGKPMPREVKSQKAQLQSIHKHGTRKDVKIPMEDKIGRE